MTIDQIPPAEKNRNGTWLAKSTTQTRPPPLRILGGHGFLPASRHLPHSTIVISGFWPRRAGPPEKRHHRRFDGLLDFSPQRQTLQRPCRARTRPKRPERLRCCALEREPTVHQHPCLWARCAVMAKHVKLAAASAGAVRQGERQMQFAEDGMAVTADVNFFSTRRMKCQSNLCHNVTKNQGTDQYTYGPPPHALEVCHHPGLAECSD